MFSRWRDGSRRGGITIVLVHGVGVSSRYMVPTLQELSRWCDVCAPDLPGFGHSFKPDEVLDARGLGRMLAEWIIISGLEDVVLVANSFGCQVAVHGALQSDRVRGTVLVGPTIDARARTISKQLMRWMRNSALEPPALSKVVLRDYLDCGVRRLWATFRLALRDRIEENLPRLRSPVLIVRGAEDRIVPQPWAEELASRCRTGRILVVAGAAHTVNFSHPSELSHAVRDFVTEDLVHDPLK